MKHYITPDNKIFGFDDTQINLIPVDAIEVSDTITMEQIPYVYFSDGEAIFNQEKYNLDIQNKLLEQQKLESEKNSAVNKFIALGLTADEIKALINI